MARKEKSFIRTLDALPLTVRTMREMRGMSLRDAADEMGIPHANLDRFEKGAQESRLSTIRACALWLEGGES